MRPIRWTTSNGTAAVEAAALAALIAAAFGAAVALVAHTPPGDSARQLGGSLARRLACVPRHPIPCGRNPLALAYGRPVGKAVRALAPQPIALRGPGGTALLPVDFRRCRRASCAAPGPSASLTAAGRRVTLFTTVEDGRASGGDVAVTYWAYRPTLGWQETVRSASANELRAAAETPLRADDHPILVPLETLAGRNHERFAAGEEPPWRWGVR